MATEPEVVSLEIDYETEHIKPMLASYTPI